MTDFVHRALRPERDDWIIRKWTDVDFYKFPMALYELIFLRNVTVTYGLINRSVKIPLAHIVDEGEFRRQLDHAMGLMFTSSEIAYISGMDAYGTRLFPEAFIAWLKKLQLRDCDYSLARKGDQYELYFTGTNEEGIAFMETIAMCIVFELKTRKALSFMPRFELEILFARAKDKLYRKLKMLAGRPDLPIVNFGTRRRHSYLWERFVTEMCMEVLGPQFHGTSNVAIAAEFSLTPTGTNAHQLPMQHVALAYPDKAAMIDAQYEVLRNWPTLFPRALRIALTDTYGTGQYYGNMPEELALQVMHTYRGERQDSGNPAEECERFIARCRRYGIDPKTRLYIFSDGLTHLDILRLYEQFHERVQVSFGWGTNLTNDFADCHPRGTEPFTHIPGVHLTWNEILSGFSLVCKITETNGVPCVKLSNNISKATGDPRMIAQYGEIFGHAGRIDEVPLV